MSNQRAHRRRKTRVDRSVLEAVAAASARGRGCTCRPDLHLRHDGGFTHLSVLHDDWCPANPDHKEQP